MVNKRARRDTQAAVFRAAAQEFAERGFDAARVDRIAARARVNKAMLYYHFGSKAELYRTLLRQVFTRAGARLQAVAGSAAPPADKLHQAIAGMADFIDDHAFFPAIMLREVADGGARLDPSTLAALAAVPAAFAAIVQQGVTSGAFRPVHPMAAYFQIFPPVVMFLAGSNIRRELAQLRLAAGTALTDAAFVAHMQEAVIRALAAAPPAPAAATTHRRSR